MAQASQSSPFNGEMNEFVRSVLAHFQVPSVSIGVIDGENSFTKVCWPNGNANVATNPTNNPFSHLG
jgi:hypothetical protein